MGKIANFFKKMFITEEIEAFKPKKETKREYTHGEGIESIEPGHTSERLSSFNLFYNRYLNVSHQNEKSKIKLYREMAEMPEVADVIEDAVIESTQEDIDGNIIKLEISDDKLAKNENISKTLNDNFNELCKRISIKSKLDDFFRTFYVDGRLYYEKVINEKNKKEGILSIKKLPSESMDFSYNIKTGKIEYFFQYLKSTAQAPINIEEAKQRKDIVLFYPEQIGFVDYGIYGRNRKDILGYLDKVKVPYNQLKLLETSVIIYRIVRAPERFVFKIDTGNMPQEQALKFVNKVKDKMRRSQTYNSQTGRLTNEPNIMCIKDDTEIPLLDGRYLTLRQVINEFNDGKENWVYSVNQETHNIEPGKIINAGITRLNEKGVKVHFDDGSYIITTPDHKFIKRDGSECRADCLKENDSLMPLLDKLEYENYSEFRESYLKNHKVAKVEFLDYESNFGCITVEGNHNFAVSQNSKSLVFVKNSILEDFYIPTCIRLSTSIPTLDGNNKTLSEIINDYNNGIENEVYSVDQKTGKPIRGKVEWAGITRKNAEMVRVWFGNGEYLDCTPDHKFVERNGNETMAKDLKIGTSLMPLYTRSKKINKNTNDYTQIYDVSDNSWKFVHRLFYNDNLKSNEVIHHVDFNRFNNMNENLVVNHKVVKIEKILEREDVGCLTIKDPGDNHNFAVAAGVFIKNSSEGRGSDISTVGGDSKGFSELDDIYYFSRKLYRALKYPLSRVSAMEEKRESDVLFVRSPMGEISRDEVKWAVFLKKQQDKICSSLEEMFLKHLDFVGIKKQYNINEFSFNIILNPPSYYKERQEQNLLETRFNNYIQLANNEEFSKSFLQKEYLEWDYEKINANAEGLKKDIELGLRQAPEEGDRRY
ncbi:MAG: portal protein [Atribacterota bacterium]